MVVLALHSVWSMGYGVLRVRGVKEVCSATTFLCVEDIIPLFSCLLLSGDA